MPAADTLSDHGRLHARAGTVSCSDDRGIFQEIEMMCNSRPLDDSTSSAASARLSLPAELFYHGEAPFRLLCIYIYASESNDIAAPHG